MSIGFQIPHISDILITGPTGSDAWDLVEQYRCDAWYREQNERLGYQHWLLNYPEGDEKGGGGINYPLPD